MSRKKKMSKEDFMFYRIDREAIWKSQNKKCKYCSCPLALSEATMDHVIPISQTGFHSTKNCVVSCYDCNQEKSDEVDYEKEDWQKMIADWKLRMDENMRRFEYRMMNEDRKGGYKKWRNYWEKRGRWKKHK